MWIRQGKKEFLDKLGGDTSWRASICKAGKEVGD
jgi:hypothetical protein